eukprot:s1894_g7.t1
MEPWPALWVSCASGEMSLQLSLVACSTAVSACAQGRRWRWAMRLFEAPAASINGGKMVKTSQSHRQRSRGYWEMSLYLLEEMCGLRMEPDKVTCAAAVAACELSAESGNSWRGGFEHGHVAKEKIASASGAPKVAYDQDGQTVLDNAVKVSKAGKKAVAVNAASAYSVGGGVMSGGRHALEDTAA